MTRYYAGGTLTPFENFILGLRRELPVLNSNGYYDGQTWYTTEEKTKLKESDQEKIRRYHRMEYMLMFDH